MTKDQYKDEVIRLLVEARRLKEQKDAVNEDWDARLKKCKRELDAALKFLVEFDSAAGTLFDKKPKPE
ncbi:MAG: hypothetical protein A2V67_11965 [Deltaproteobacteria bacterium RBG_13_61_14]|nr:MAG: hypothetical protein A2V67_11965 [Deltaproteobacteria bacterium RBG_13_61_14]